MLLNLEAVTKSFGGFQLHPLTLSIEKGEFFSLLGPSGCGKTTVLRLIGGFEMPTSGKVILNGRDITQLPPHKRSVHTVFQRYALFPHLTVWENVAFPLHLKKLPSAEIAQRVEECLKLVEILDLQDRRTHQISGGQAQRTALARALVGKPDLLLLDEPLSALDPELRMKMREELKAICKKVGITFLLVTHDQEEALQLSDRIAVFKAGQCLQVGTPKTIYEDPAEPFVARFIGAVNEIPGEIQGEAAPETGEVGLVSPLGTFKLKKNGQPLPQSVSVILRPEKMRLLRSKSTTQENLMEGEIQDLTYLGSRTEYSVKIGPSVFKVFEQELERLKKRRLNVGDRVFLAWRSEDAIILAQNS
ncbi:ABC transporter ATP-binding protein [bacterium]|nr:ABC transporter ATP-binding protein [bacterium]NBX82040.1 ABC transporter ATP-binding protein [bacterium]